MKIALFMAPKGADPSAYIILDDQLEGAIARAADMGYDGIELAVGDAEEIDPVRFASWILTNGVSVSALSTGRVFAEHHVWLTSPDENIRGRATELINGIVELAARVGAPRITIGRTRGSIAPGQTLPNGDARFIEALTGIAERALAHRIEVVVEPGNRYEINYINSVAPDGIALLDRVQLPNVKLLPDVFHMNIEDASIAGSLEVAGSRIGYVHLADSNRMAPGNGHLDFAAIAGALTTIGFDGWLAADVLPRPTAEQAASQAIAYLRSLQAAGLLPHSQRG